MPFVEPWESHGSCASHRDSAWSGAVSAGSAFSCGCLYRCTFSCLFVNTACLCVPVIISDTSVDSYWTSQSNSHTYTNTHLYRHRFNSALLQLLMLISCCFRNAISMLIVLLSIIQAQKATLTARGLNCLPILHCMKQNEVCTLILCMLLQMFFVRDINAVFTVGQNNEMLLKVVIIFLYILLRKPVIQTYRLTDLWKDTKDDNMWRYTVFACVNVSVCVWLGSKLHTYSLYFKFKNWSCPYKGHSVLLLNTYPLPQTSLVVYSTKSEERDN